MESTIAGATRELWERGRFAIAVITAGSMALAGCSSEHSPDASSRLPLVASEAATAPPSDADEIDTDLAAKSIPDGQFNSYGIKEAKAADEADIFPYDPSAPVTDITLGKDRKLHFTPFDTMDPSSKSNLLGVVNQAAPYLTSAMRDGHLTTVHFRVFKSSEPGDTAASPTSLPRPSNSVLYATNPVTNKKEIFDFLPTDITGGSSISTESLSAELTHEAIHAALHNLDETFLTPDEATTLQHACETLKRSVDEDIALSSYDLITKLGKIRQAAEPAAHASYDAVIRALQNGTYAQLPQARNDEPQAPGCVAQDPYSAYLAETAKRGLGDHEALHTRLSPIHKSELISDIEDSWGELLRQTTTYGPLCEGAYSTDASDGGHPYDNVEELMTSLTNIALRDPEDLSERLIPLDSDALQAVRKVLATSFKILIQNSGGNPQIRWAVNNAYTALSPVWQNNY